MKNRLNFIILILFAVITIVVWQIPGGKLIFYPFTILGTWFHEMGHGFAAIILGGDFHRLEIYSNGSGLAVHSGSLLLGNIGRAIVAAGGPIGTTIAGAIFILLSGKVKLAKLALILLGALLILSSIIWIRSTFGFIAIILIGIIILLIAMKASEKVQIFTIQLLGVQACLSVYLSVDYLLSAGGIVDGRLYPSDTARIAENLFFPYWFWGGFIILFSVLVIFLSLRRIYKIENLKV